MSNYFFMELNMKKCSKCGVEKPLDGFYFRKESGKHRNECTECVKAARSKYRKDNPETVNAANRRAYAKKPGQYRAARKERPNTRWATRSRSSNARARALGTAGVLTSSQVRLMFESHGNSCYYCQKILDTSKREATVDHATPLARGGKNVITNCVPACLSCNASKGDRTEQEFNDFLNTRGAEV